VKWSLFVAGLVFTSLACARLATGDAVVVSEAYNAQGSVFADGPFNSYSQMAKDMASGSVTETSPLTGAVASANSSASGLAATAGGVAGGSDFSNSAAGVIVDLFPTASSFTLEISGQLDAWTGSPPGASFSFTDLTSGMTMAVASFTDGTGMGATFDKTYALTLDTTHEYALSLLAGGSYGSTATGSTISADIGTFTVASAPLPRSAAMTAALLVSLVFLRRVRSAIG